MALAIFLGIRQRGRSPTRNGWSAWAALIVAPFALLLLIDSADHDPSQVNRAVEGVYVKRPHVRRAKANCTEGEPNPDGSEWWVCDLEAFGPTLVDTLRDSDTCNVDVRRFPSGDVTVRIRSCLNDDLHD
jgi:hypothetical protein